MDTARIGHRCGAAGVAAVLLLVMTSALGQEIDAATKKLAAANGLYQRQLYKLAADEYAAFLNDNPAHPQATTARYALAICRFRTGAYPAAITELNVVLQDEKFPQHDESMLVLAHCHLSNQDHAKALAALDALLAKHPKSSTIEAASLNRAQVLYMLGRKRESAAACEAFLKAYPESGKRPDALYFLALGQHGDTKFDEARKTLAELIKTYPNSRHQVDAGLLMGQCLEGKGQHDKAADQYRAVLQSAPTGRQAEVLYALGVAYYRLGRYEESAKTLATLLSQHAQSTHVQPARLQLGLTWFAARKIEDCRRVLAEVVQADASRANTARYWLAMCDMVEKNYAAARATLDELAKLQPPPVDAGQLAMDRADCLLGLKEYARAAVEYEAFQKQHAAHARLNEAAYRQAFCLHKSSQFEASQALCVRLMGSENAFAQPARELAGENLYLLGRYAEAEPLFVQLAAGAKGPARQRFVLRTGQCAYFAGQYGRAVEILRPLADDKASVLDEELSRSLLLCGDALLQIGQHREASEMLGKYVGIAKADKQEAQFKLALAQLRGKDVPAAEKMFQEIIQATDRSPWVLRAQFEYGQLKYKQNRPVEAGELLKKLASSQPPAELAAPAQYLLAWIDLDAKRYPDAAKGFGQMVQQFPQHALAAEAMFHQGAAWREGGQWKEASVAFQSYLAQHPAGPYASRAKQLLAGCMLKLDQHEQAIRQLTELAGDPKTATDDVLYDLAWAHQAGKNAAAAQAAYRRLLKDLPASRLVSPARCELAELLYQQDGFAEAAQLLEQVVADSNADGKVSVTAVYRLGFCYEKLNQPAKAAEMFKSFIARKGNDELVGWAHYQAGVNLARQNKLPEAQGHFAAVLQSNPKPDLAAVTLLKLGETQAQAEDYAGSAKSYQQFLSRFAGDRFAYQAQFGLGWALENQKEYAEARRWYIKVIAAHNGPTAARAQFQIGETFFAEGQFEKAAAALLAVADVYAYPEWSARALFEAGRAFEQLQQIDQARQQYEAVRTRYKDAPEAALAGKRLQAIK